MGREEADCSGSLSVRRMTAFLRMAAFLRRLALGEAEGSLIIKESQRSNNFRFLSVPPELTADPVLVKILKD